MDIWLSVLVWPCLLLCAAALMVLHVRTWHRIRRQEPHPDVLQYYRRQYRRRMQASAMLGLTAVAVLVGQLGISQVESAVAVFVYWGVLLLMVGWIGLLAAADMLATKRHFSRLRQTYLVEQAKLHAEIRRIQTARGNGKAPKRHRGPEEAIGNGGLRD